MFKREKIPARTNLITLRVSEEEAAMLESIRRRLKLKSIADVIREGLSLLAETPDQTTSPKRQRKT